MQTRTAKIMLVALALWLPLALASDDAFLGTWKLNLAKSKFDPGPPPKGMTITIDPGGKVSVLHETPEGPMTWSYTANPGGEAAITGMENATVVEKRVDDRTIEHTWNLGEHGKMNGKGVLSKNGKTMTYTLSGTNPKGQNVHNVEVYEKQ